MAWVDSDFDNTNWVNRNVNAIYISSTTGKPIANGGDGSPRNPVRTIVEAKLLDSATVIYIFSAGTYEAENLNLSGSNILIGDTEGVILTSSAGGVRYIIGTASQNYDFRNINFFDYDNFTISASGFQIILCSDCTFDTFLFNTKFRRDTATFGDNLLQRCTFINCTNARFDRSIKCQFIKTSLDGVNYVNIEDCDFDSLCNIKSTSTFDQFDGCNVRCNINGITASAYKTANPTLLINSLTAPDDNGSNDPLFNDAANDDYTLSLASPNRYLGLDGKECGIGVAINSNGNGGFTNVSDANWNGSAWVQDVVTTKGVIQSLVIDAGEEVLSTDIRVIGTDDDANNAASDFSLPYDPVDIPSLSIVDNENYLVFGTGTVLYDGTTYAVGEIFMGDNGVTAYTEPSGTPDVYKMIEFPDQRTVEVRYSNISAIDCADVSNLYKPFYRGLGILVDATGKTIGEAGYDFTNQKVVSARWYQVQITMQEKGF